MTCPVCARPDADSVHSLVTCEGCNDEPCDGCDCHDAVYTGQSYTRRYSS
jgi:hypothetical protein